MAPSNKRKALSLAERVDVVKRLDAKESQSSIAKSYGVHPSQISRILKNKDNILDDWQNNTNPERKRKRAGKAEDVEASLLRWFGQALSRQLPVSGPLLMEKANALAENLGITGFRATVGWLERWKERNGIKFKRQHGEKQNVDNVNTERWVTEVLPYIFKDFQPRDIFNADETGLYWRALPEGTLTFQHSEATGCKVPKDRVTLLLACNMDGSEKLELLTIGKCRQPRCFKNVKRLPVAYEANKNAWMTADIWREWLKKIDQMMGAKKRQIVMLCDNCAAHSVDVRLSNIKLVFLPPNTTSLIQPMGQGIIANFKQHYRSLVLRHLTDVMEVSDETQRAAEAACKLTLLDSLHMQKVAWDRVTASTIGNCYRRASFVKDPDSTRTARWLETASNISECKLEFHLPASVTEDAFNRYVAVDIDLQTAADSTDVELCAGLKPIKDEDSDGEYNHGETYNRASNGGQAAGIQTPVTFTAAMQSLHTIRAYLEAAGCDSYAHFYALSDQIYDINKQNSV